jgi:hypothetical protein
LPLSGQASADCERLKTLALGPVEVIVIDRQNYHLFQPLLYQVATAGQLRWALCGIQPQPVCTLLPIRISATSAFTAGIRKGPIVGSKKRAKVLIDEGEFGQTSSCLAVRCIRPST